jgi:hypothetical protein
MHFNEKLLPAGLSGVSCTTSSSSAASTLGEDVLISVPSPLPPAEPAQPPLADPAFPLVPCDAETSALYSCSTLFNCALPPSHPVPCEFWVTTPLGPSQLIHQVEVEKELFQCDTAEPLVHFSSTYPAVLMGSVPYLDSARYSEVVEEVNTAAVEPPKLRLWAAFLLTVAAVASQAVMM